MNSKITTKGQITLPKEIRKFLDVNPSDRIRFVIEGDKVILKSVKTLKDFRGAVPPKTGATIKKEREHSKRIIAEKVIQGME